MPQRRQSLESQNYGDREDMEPDPEWIVSIEDADNVLDAFRAGVFRGCVMCPHPCFGVLSHSA